jgi:multidrug efflux pump
VADTVAAPIEQQVNGVEGMLYMSSQMGTDGSYTLTVTFDVSTDLNTALVMVQNRVALAMPQLPTAVQNQGITIRKRTPDILMVVSFFSPDGRYDDLFLSNYATIYARDEILRVDGVADVGYLGQRDYSIRAWLDASMLVILKPFADRHDPKLRDTAIMARLRKRWREEVPDARVLVFGASPVPGLSVAGGFKIIVEGRGGVGLAALEKQTNDLITRMRELPELNSVSTQFRTQTPQLFCDIDRTKVASLGVNLNDVNQTLGMYLGSLYVNSFNEFGRHWQVTVQADGKYRSRPEDINLFKVRNNQGRVVPLGSLVSLRPIGGPVMIIRHNLFIGAPITGNLRPGVSSGDAIAAVNRLSHDLPLTMKTEWTELMFVQIRAGNTALYIFLLSAAAVFLALAALYESWTLPLAVILVVPLCLLCSVAGVLYAHKDVDIFVQIGLVVLVGLACKNAILIVEFASQLHREGRKRRDATLESSRLRLRPILMTSFAFILGVVPLVIATGAGAEMRRSLGTAVFAGMLGVTAFGVFLTPVFYYVIDWLTGGAPVTPALKSAEPPVTVAVPPDGAAAATAITREVGRGE